MTESSLINKLEAIASKEYCLNQGDKAIDIALEMIEHLGSTNPYLRDDLIYTIFYYWIIAGNVFANQELIMLLETLIDEKHLFFNIGVDEDDSVLMRSFSLLVISLILARNIEKRFINNDLFYQLFNKIISYYNKEKDFRGYDIAKGWIHSAAHGADALGYIVLSDDCNGELIKQILTAITSVLNNHKYILSHEEDERVARVINNIFTRKLVDNEEIYTWLNDLVSKVNELQNHDKYIFRVNTKNLIRSIYFSNLNINESNAIIEKLGELEAKFNRFRK